MKQQLICELNEFVSFMISLDNLKDEIWFSPLSEGKWRIHDIVTHIMKWDDYLGFNEQSIIYGKERTKKEIIEETIRNRQIMINNINMLEDNKFSVVYLGDRGFTIESY